MSATTTDHGPPLKRETVPIAAFNELRAERDKAIADMSATEVCEVCEKPIVGESIVHPEEGDSYCAWCVVSLLGAERDSLRAEVEKLETTVDRLVPYAEEVSRLRAEVERLAKAIEVAIWAVPPGPPLAEFGKHEEDCALAHIDFFGSVDGAMAHLAGALAELRGTTAAEEARKARDPRGEALREQGTS